MSRQPSFVKGIEIDAGTVRRSGFTNRPIAVRLTRAERAFLLHRIGDITATAEAILHNPHAGKMISPWSRDHVVQRIVQLRNTLREDRDVFFLISSLDRAIFIDAIVHNSYFAAMHDTDPRLTIDAVRQANALRDRLAAAIGQRIARVPLGVGRTRLPQGPCSDG